MKSEKVIISAKDYDSNKKLTDDLTMDNNTPNQNKFQYKCSFCWRELPNNSVRFREIGACPLHFAVADKLINGICEHEANYFNSLEVCKQ